MDVSKSLMYISPVKREQRLKDAKIKRKLEMRAELPVLDRYEVRRHRLPLYKALVAELQEKNFPSAACFLQQLVEYHEKIREEHGPDTPVWCRKRLMLTKDVLIHLYDQFTLAEKHNMNEQRHKEFDVFLKLAIEYAMAAEDDFWWLGQQILHQCIDIGALYKADGGMRYALANYIMGKFLLDKMRDACAVTHSNYLHICRDLSRGMKWSARNVLATKQDTLFVESAKLMLRALLLEAHTMRLVDPSSAIDICKIAKKMAADSCDRGAEAEVLMLMGICAMDCDDPKSSCEALYRSLVLNVKLNNLTAVCETRILLALSYMKNENYVDALYQLETLLRFAEENQFLHYVGLAYRYLGEIYINKSQPHLATPILAKAVDIFVELKDAFNRRRTKNLSAVSGGQQHLAQYIQLLLNCGRSGQEGRDYMKILVRWKDDRTPFWDEEKEFCYDIEYPEILYGQIEDKEEILKSLKHIFQAPSEESSATREEEEEMREEEEEEQQMEESEKPSSEDTRSYLLSADEEMPPIEEMEELEQEEEQKTDQIYQNDNFENEDDDDEVIVKAVSVFGSKKFTVREEQEEEETPLFEEEEQSLFGELEGQHEEINVPLDLPKIEAFAGEEEYVDSEIEDKTYNTEGEPEEMVLAHEEESAKEK